jgi:hypothetical protein
MDDKMLEIDENLLKLIIIFKLDEFPFSKFVVEFWYSGGVCRCALCRDYPSEEKLL